MFASFIQDYIFFLTAVVVLCSTWILASLFRTGKRKLRLPPGPPGWPIVKNLPVFLKRPVSTNDQFYFTQMAKKYGDIYMLQVGSQILYVLTNIDQIREFLSHSKTHGRPGAKAYQIVFGPEAEGVVSANGPAWKAVKQLILNLFRELGVGRGIFEERIQSEMERFITKLDSLVGNYCSDMLELFTQAVCNITCGILFDQQFDYEDPEFKKISGLMLALNKSMGPGGVAIMNKTVCSLPFGPGKKLRGILEQFGGFLRDKFEGAKKANKNNFVKAFLKEMENGKAYFNEGNLTVTSLDLFFAGTETVSSTLAFALIYLTRCPHVQLKCQEELDEFVKFNMSMPSFSDSPKLPFFQAVVHETQRIGNVAPLGVPHVVTEDLELFGYDFQKGTVVVANFATLYMDPEEFTNPCEFNPERFIKDGKFKAHENIMPFSTGRRACPGEQLARMELFLFLTGLLYRYTFTAPKDTKMPETTEGIHGATRTPPPFIVIINRRGK